MNTEIRSRMEELLNEEFASGQPYVTVRTVSKRLKIKQSEVMENMPDGIRMEPSSGGTLAENRLVQSDNEFQEEPEEENAMNDELEVQDPEEDDDFEVEDGEVDDSEAEEEDQDSSEEDGETSGENVPEASDEEVVRVICEICGAPIRSTTEDQRGVCPRCWAELVRNSGNSTKTLMDMSEEDFGVVIEDERARRQFLIDYKASRILTAEEFESMKDMLIPVKDVFAAGRALKIGPGRIAQAVGGDKFRHEPKDGFGSVWTPFFYGARKAWYFDKGILDRLPELKREPKPKKEKAEGTGEDGAPVGRKGARGKAMKVVTPPAEEVLA